jgi:hypothetical protein
MTDQPQNPPVAPETAQINEPEQPMPKTIFNGRMDACLEMEEGENKGGFTSYQKLDEKDVSFKVYTDEGILKFAGEVQFDNGSGRVNYSVKTKVKGQEPLTGTGWFALGLTENEVNVYLPWRLVSGEELNKTLRVIKGYFFVQHAQVKADDVSADSFTKTGVGLSGEEEAKIAFPVEDKGRLG